MEHIYHSSNFGEDWFSYKNLYSKFVNELSNNSKIVEVGVWKGKSVAYLAVEIINSKKSIHIDAVDTWMGSEEHTNPDSQFYNKDLLENENWLYETFLRNIEPVKHIITPVRLSSVNASELYDDNSIDVVFIDAAHDYESVKADIIAWYPKVKNGGYIAGHDYHHEPVKNAVHEILSTKSTIETSSEEDVWFLKKNDKPKIYQVSSFYNELDVLELRLQETYDYTDKFIIVEATKTHAGIPKDLFFEKNKQRFEKYKDKIIHVVCDFDSEIYQTYKQNIKSYGADDYVADHEVWVREWFQRDYALLFSGVNFQDNDLIIVVDNDEIVNMHSLTKFLNEHKNLNEPHRFAMHFMHYYFNTNIYDVNSGLDHKWYHPIIAKYSSLKDYNNSASKLRLYGSMGIWNLNLEKNIIEDGGWHFTFQSDSAGIFNKVKNFGHSNDPNFNVDIPQIEESIKKLDLFYWKDSSLKLRQFPLELLPKTVLNNMSRWERFIRKEPIDINTNEILVVVAGHINNEQKKEHVLDLLSHLKAEGLKTCYVTHTPMFIEKISENTDFVFYDKNNLLIEYKDFVENCDVFDTTALEYGHNYFWADTGFGSTTTNYVTPHSGAVMVLLKNAIDIANSNHFKWIVFLEYDIVPPNCGFSEFIKEKIFLLNENNKKCLLYPRPEVGILYPGILIFQPNEINRHEIFLRTDWYSSPRKWLTTWKLGTSEEITDKILNYVFTGSTLEHNIQEDAKKYWNSDNYYTEIHRYASRHILFSNRVELIPYKHEDKFYLTLYIINDNDFPVTITNLKIVNTSRNSTIYQMDDKIINDKQWFIDFLHESLYNTNDVLYFEYTINLGKETYTHKITYDLNHIEKLYNYVSKFEFK